MNYPEVNPLATGDRKTVEKIQEQKKSESLFLALSYLNQTASRVT